MKIIVNKYKFNRLLSLINRQLGIVFCAIAIVLSGCVKYDTGVNFSSLNYGEIVEHIQLGEQLNSFSQNAVQTWVASIEQRARQAEGKIERLTDRELQVTIPFNNAQDLVTKIDRYFNPNLANTESGSKFNSHMQINQSNFLLVVRSHLIYDIDLRALSIESSDPKVSVASDNFVDLDFSLQSPWGVKNSDAPGNIVGVKTTNDRQMTWQLKPGEINHIDAIFWLPNSLGIGAIFIILISGGGYYLKYRQLPWQL
ncbi:DUF3153 domain-containing protein [Chamaesiphon sp. VAR_48_metabat_135_sub]|uniref:DUF3153 domain-containing protein n=1 Tax=Chamaesiphon sp. VAR_48_metabat_135_sub TaxID=2964699 RepID=UPI002869EFC4|nr:DUF3153 domain-containing protein [Chamaesiphon sp. VAR_48_metabat_135_sub]